MFWAYWPILMDMAGKWAHDPQYSHAYLVPAFAAYLLWLRRPVADAGAWRPSWWGLPVLAAGVLTRLIGAYVYFEWLEAFSLLFLLAGAILFLAGLRALRWSWPAIAFLGFMIPLPFSVETAFSSPLQRLATLVSTYLLQSLGQPAFSEGNVICVNEARIGVVEACNGLGMLLLFFAIATAVAFVVRRNPAERVLLIASAAPVAITANVMRVTFTCFLTEYADTRTSEWFHNLAGWLMMPFALMLLWLELHVVSRMFVAAELRQKLFSFAAASDRLPGANPDSRLAV